MGRPREPPEELIFFSMPDPRRESLLRVLQIKMGKEECGRQYAKTLSCRLDYSRAALDIW